MIPRIFHQIWVWEKEIPRIYLDYIWNWIDLHPDYIHTLWGDDSIKKLNYLEVSKLDLCQNASEKADYIRICALLEFWGVYIDTDMECYKNIDILLQNENFVIWQENINTCNNAFIAATEEHPLLKEIYWWFEKTLQKKTLPTRLKTWPYYISNYIKKHKIKILPWHYFYPEHWNNLEDAQKYWNEVFANHHYSFWGEKYFLSKAIFAIKKKLAMTYLGLLMCRVWQSLIDKFLVLRIKIGL